MNVPCGNESFFVSPFPVYFVVSHRNEEMATSALRTSVGSILTLYTHASESQYIAWAEEGTWQDMLFKHHQ